MEDVKIRLTEDIAKKIIGNNNYAQQYLVKLNEIIAVDGLTFRNITRGKNVGQQVVSNSTPEIWRLIVNTWNYEVSKNIIRTLFKTTEKYRNGKDADNAMALLIEEWQNLNLGEISWPFSQGQFDAFVQSVNSENSNGTIKDEKVKQAAVKYRRIKEINTVRNDFIETLIFEKNENITPTLDHRRGVDFFVNGISFDQKVAKSPTNEFKRKIGEDWRQVAITQPEKVAEYLYTFQDEGRFGADPRLLVVYIDEDVSITQIRDIINHTNLNNYLTVNFTFNHKIQGNRNYRVPCFVVLLYNKDIQ
ncbi:MAG: hypothetical protein LBV75_08830 [Paludibacter sp.]|jgi:hypothetical protein|nr:hypothetical protein [Paludibacter sp.]